MTAARTQVGLYVHIPFCRQRCHFCAFYLDIPKGNRVEAFLLALERELDLLHEQRVLGGRPLDTIYVGGGTPTVIPAPRLSQLLDRIRTTFPVVAQPEVTIEAHPATVDRDVFRRLADAGCTRLSLGAESMNQEEFGPIGRPGVVAETIRAVADAKAVGLTNINLDVMYGLPGQRPEAWQRTLRGILELEPTHISCYALTIEEGTTLAQDIARGTVPAPDDAVQIEMEATAESLLAQAGFVRYEISNYAKPGFACRHNQLYWTDQEYLGLGPSAQSYLGGVRFGNVANLQAYVDDLTQGRLPVSERIPLSAEAQQREALIFGLRLLEGTPAPFQEKHRIVLTELKAKGLILEEAGRIKLTCEGRRFADTVAEALY